MNKARNGNYLSQITAFGFPLKMKGFLVGVLDWAASDVSHSELSVPHESAVSLRRDLTSACVVGSSNECSKFQLGDLLGSTSCWGSTVLPAGHRNRQVSRKAKKLKKRPSSTIQGLIFLRRVKDPDPRDRPLDSLFPPASTQDLFCLPAA